MLGQASQLDLCTCFTFRRPHNFVLRSIYVGLVHISRFVDRAILYELHTRFVRRAFSQELMIVPEPQRICRAYNNWQNRKLGKGLKTAKNGLFLSLGLGTSSAQSKNLRPLFNRNIPLISDNYGIRNHF